jgi:NADPH:quinone reductase-like Zn-dependent oxidoreductase
VCSTAKVDLVRAIGADHVIDYTREDITSGQRRYDVIIDIDGSRPLGQLRRILTPQGTLVVTGANGPLLGGIDRNLYAATRSPWGNQQLKAFLAKQNRADLITLADLIESGAITPVIDRSYPLGEAAAAVRHLADGRARGKVVISV